MSGRVGTALEDLSRVPKNGRSSTVPWQTVELVCSIRKEQPAWSKHKIAVIRERDHDVKRTVFVLESFRFYAADSLIRTTVSAHSVSYWGIH